MNGVIVSTDEKFERVRNAVQVHCEDLKDTQRQLRREKDGAGANAITAVIVKFRSWCRNLGLLEHPLDVDLDSGVGKPRKNVKLPTTKDDPC